MTATEAQQLKPGDKVIYADGVKGEVRATSEHAIEIQWADGQHGCISPFDCQSMAREQSERTR